MREKMVTRTITRVTYTVMVVELATQSVKTVKVELPETDLKPEKLRELIAGRLDKGLQFVMIQSEEKVDELYGMTEAQFLALATRLPDRK